MKNIIIIIIVLLMCFYILYYLFKSYFIKIELFDNYLHNNILKKKPIFHSKLLSSNYLCPH